MKKAIHIDWHTREEEILEKIGELTGAYKNGADELSEGSWNFNKEGTLIIEFIEE